MSARKAIRFLYENSPRAWILELRSRLGRPARRSGGDTYFQALVLHWWNFLQFEYPDACMNWEEFRNAVYSHADLETTKKHNVYAQDLWSLLAPDFKSRLPEYYRSTELHSTMRFISYATNPRLIEKHYVEPYRYARNRLDSFSVLEIGAGIPHGLIHQSLFGEPGDFCSSLTTVDIDTPYSRFVAWFAATRNIPFEFKPAIAGVPVELGEGPKYDFVVAKDVLEHLEDPRKMIQQILATASDRALLALDIEDKGLVARQHISPQLSALEELLNSNGFVRLRKLGVLSFFSRGTPS